MKLQDLRKGNCVLRPDGENCHDLNGQRADKIRYFDSNLAVFDKKIHYNIAYLNPIPITKELLESIGYGFSNFMNCWVNTDYGIPLYYKTSKDHFITPWADKKVIIRGFHHLQNIIHDLCGVELSLTECTKEK